jgi:hypothetical protein
MIGFSLFRPVQMVLFLLCAVIASTPAQAHLTINLEPARGKMSSVESREDVIRTLFPGESEKIAKVIEGLPEHVKAWPGMMIVKVGSLWASVTIIFPDENSTRMVHLGSVVRPFSDWAASNRHSYFFMSGQSSVMSPDAYFLIAQNEKTVGDPFEKTPRSYHDDGNLQMPTLLELRMPLNGEALVNVLTARADLHQEFGLAGTSGPCGWVQASDANCTLGPILSKLVAAAYGTGGMSNPTATTPLALGLNLARAYGPESLRGNGCPIVEPRRIADNESLDQSTWAPVTVGMMRLLDLAPESLPASPFGSAILLRDYPDLVELALGGVQDPAGLSLIDCALRREILHGEVHPLPNTILRSRWYDRATHLIDERVTRRPDAPKRDAPEILFFDAASHVTRTLGVGLVDVVERNPNMAGTLNSLLADRDWPKVVAGKEWLLQALDILSEDSDIDQVKLPSKEARALLRELNLLLFRNNRQMIREINSRLEHAPNNAPRFPDPAAPPGAGTLSKGLWFDLRMVLFEQGLIEGALVEHRKQNGYYEVLPDIDSAARLARGLRVMAGYHRSAWIDRVVYGAVAKAEAEIAAEGRYLRPDGGPLFAPLRRQTGPASFDSYWHRVTIGSTYVLVLHYLEQRQDLEALCEDPALLERDRAPCRDAVETLIANPPPMANGLIDYGVGGDHPEQIASIATLSAAYMRLRLEAAPRLDEGTVRRELQEIDKADFSDGLEAELAQVLAVLQPNAGAVEVLRCESTHAGPGWEKLTINPDALQDARAALVNPSMGHWTTLADLFDIMKGGALPRPPRFGEGGSRDEQICEGIERRYQAVEALLAGRARPPESPVRIPYDDDGAVANVGIDAPRAVWMRAMVRQIWPHLARDTCPQPSKAPANCGVWSEPPAKVAVNVVNSYDEFRRIKAKLRLLAEPRNSESLGPLGFDPQRGDPASLLVRIEGPALAQGPRIIQEGNVARLSPDDGTAGFLARFDMADRLQRLDAQRDAIRYLESARPDTITPLPIPITPRDTNGDAAAEAVAAGHRAPAGLRMETLHAGSFTDESGLERELFTGTLTYVVPVASSRLGAAKSDGSNLETERLAATTAESTPLSRPMSTIPLGLTIRDLIQLGDGRYSVATGSGTNQLLQSPAETRAALAALGVPDIFRGGSQRLEASLEDKTLSVILVAEPELAGITLNPVRVKLITDGKLDEEVPERLAAALRESFVETFNQRGLESLTKLLSPFTLNNLSVGDLRVNFQFSPDDSCVTLAPTDNCAKIDDLVEIEILEPSVQAAFKLSVQSSGGPSVSVVPKLQLSLTNEGLVLRSSDLSDLGDDALDQVEQQLADAIQTQVNAAAIRGIAALSDIRVSFGRDLTRGTSTVARGVHVGLSFIAKFPDACEVPLTLVLDLEKLGEVDKVLENLLAGGADALADCAADYVLDRLDDVLKLREFLDRPYQLGDAQFSIRYDSEALDKGLPIGRSVAFALEYDGAEATGLTISVDDGLALPVNADERKALDALVTKAFAKRLTGLLGGVVRIDSLALTQSAPGRSIRVMADLTVENVPFLGDISMPRIDLADPDNKALEGTLKETLSNNVAAELHARLPEEMELPFVGRYMRRSLALDLSDSDRPKLDLDGDLEVVSGLKIPARIRIPLKGSLSDLDVEVDETKALEQLNAFSPLKDAFGFGPLEVTNARIGAVAGRRGRYAVYFDAKLGVEGLFKLGADNLMLDQSGLRLGATISGSIPYPVETSVVALSSIGVTIHTGEDGAKSGLELDTDVSALSSATAALAKIKARLDLRDIGNLRFRMDGDVIVLDAIPLLFARGDVALKDLSFEFEAGTVPALENVIAIYGSAALSGSAKPPQFNANTRLAVLRVRLAESQFRLVIDDPGELFFQSETNLLVAKGTLQFESGLDLSDLDLRGGMDLDLFGWSPGGVAIAIDTRRANAQMKVLFAKLGITVRHVDLFDPQVIIDMLMSLFDISLEDLLNVRLDKLEIAAGSIGADGGTGGDGQTSDSQDEADGDSPSNANSDSAPQPKPRDVPPPDPDTGQKDIDNGHPANEGGTVPGTRYCDPILREENGTLRYQLYVSARPFAHNEKTFDSHPHPGNLRFHGETFRRTEGDAMSTLCSGPIASEFPSKVGQDWIPRLTSRLYGGQVSHCIGQHNVPVLPEINGDFAINTAEDEALGFPFVHAKSPLLCWELLDGTNTFAYAQIFEHQNGTLRALIFCDGPEQIAAFKNEEDRDLYTEVCVNGAMSRALDTDIARDAAVDIKERDGVTRIIKPTAEQALIENLRATLRSESPPLTHVYTLTNGVEARARGRDLNGAIWSKVSFVTLSSGRHREGFVFDAALAKVLHHSETQELPISLLQAWYDRGTASASGRPKLVYEPPEGSAGPKLWLQGYGDKPKLDDLDWILADIDKPARSAVKLLSSTAGNGPKPTVGGANFVPYVQLVHSLLRSATEQWPDKRRFEVILSDHDAAQNRRYIALRPQGASGPNDKLLAAALIPDDKNATAELSTYKITPSGAGAMEVLTHGQLRCRIKLAHDNSSFSPLPDASAAAIDPWIILGAPSKHREELNLANDPILAMFIKPLALTECDGTPK